MNTRFGVVVLVGRPNAGKSSLTNALVGVELAAVSEKPQTTWQPTEGVVTRGDTQLHIIDAPGVMDPSEPLHHGLLDHVRTALERADMILHVTNPGQGGPADLSLLLPDDFVPEVPVATILTHADRHPAATAPSASDSQPTFSVSSTSGAGLDRLLDWMEKNAPVGQFRFDPDDAGTQPVRFFVQEYVRESAFRHLTEELPYAVAVEVEEFREDRDPVYIRVTCYVEKESQKGILIGNSGKMIRTIGSTARSRIEGLIGRQVYLDIWVKVRHKWRRKEAALRAFGYAAPVNGNKKTGKREK